MSGSLINLWLKATSAIVKYGFVIEYRELEAPRTGIFDGLKISIDPNVDFEMQCFILLHLFGHSVQWTALSLSEKLTALEDCTDKTKFMRALHDYEYEAARFGMQLMREIGVGDLDQWFSDFVAADWQYVERFYATGTIPPIAQKQVEVRYAF